MEHAFKQKSLQGLQRQNLLMTGVVGVLSLAVLLLGGILFTSEKRWVLLPMSQPDQKIEMTSKGYTKSYLRTWAIHVMETLMTVSPDTVERQTEEVRIVSSKHTPELEAFFKSHIDYIKGSDVSSVFFPKEVKERGPNTLEVRDVFRYWMGESDKSVSLNRSYLLTFRQGARGIILLQKIEERLQ